MLRLVMLFCVAACVLCLPRQLEETVLRSVYLTHQNIEQEGYRAETHHVVSEGGYILEMHRIPFRRYETEAYGGSRPVVFLMHGLTAASNAFIFLGSVYAIAYNFADAGFDVWIGNARGTKNSRQHLTLGPDSDTVEYFDFSWEEIGMYDIPAMVDYVLEYTGRDRLHYVGHSQGGTVFLVLNSLRPEYNSKFASAHLLAGVGYMEYFPDEQLAGLARLTDLLYATLVSMQYVEIFPPNATAVEDVTRRDYCLGDVRLIDQYAARIGLEDIFTNNDNAGGGSVKQFAHYGQNIRDKLFRRYHYGTNQNQALYGSDEPPLFDIGLITVNTTMHYTISDILFDERDVYAMVADMPYTVARRVARDSFLHSDFVNASDVKELVTDFMIEAILYVEENVDFEQEEIEEESNEENATEKDANEETTLHQESNENEEDNPEVLTDPKPDSATNVAVNSAVLCLAVSPLLLQLLRS